MFKPFIQSPNIWRHVSPVYFSPSQIIFPKKFSKIKFCVPLSNTIKHTTPTINTQIKNKRKRGRRKLKSGEEYELALHTKDNDDNIKRYE